MALIYSEEPFTGNAAMFHRINPNNAWKKHYENYLYLQFMQQRGDRLERLQATKELDIAEKKMKYWENRPNFDKSLSLRDAEKLNRMWRDK